VVDPKWDFVVLNVGSIKGSSTKASFGQPRRQARRKGHRAHGLKRPLHRNVVPGWKLGEVIEGDEVSPAHPAS